MTLLTMLPFNGKKREFYRGILFYMELVDVRGAEIGARELGLVVALIMVQL